MRLKRPCDWSEELNHTGPFTSNSPVFSQARLHARLLNSTITSNKMAITPLVMSNGKTPQSFPTTKGEFEHLTSMSILVCSVFRVSC